MRVVKIKDANSRNRLVQRKRRLVVFWRIARTAALFVFLSGIFYLFFFSQVFQINEIKISGLELVSEVDVRTSIENTLDQKEFKHIRPNRNIFLFDAAALASTFVEKYPELESAASKKDFFHVVEFNFVERKTVGIWCHNEECLYFDKTGTTWGKAPKSSGTLLMSIIDERETRPARLDSDMLKAFGEAEDSIAHIGSGIKNVVIPKDSFRDFWVHTTMGYPIILNLDSDMPGQFKIFKVFLDQREGEEFIPQYVDLRIDGRIYYK